MERLSQDWKEDYRYCVRFWTRNGAGKEEYYYWPKDRTLAEEHFHLFKKTADDPSYLEMYEKIEFLTICGKVSAVVDAIHFA